MSIIFIEPNNVPGSPAFERASAFKEFFTENGIECRSVSRIQINFLDLILRKERKSFVFLSMPSFRKWWLFFVPWVKVIFDIRDGWSIAIASGYGGLTKRKPLKAFFARFIERFAIRCSFLTITCTPGLKEYLERISGRAVLLVPNGISTEDMRLASNLRGVAHSSKNTLRKNRLILCCAGKFSEYGDDKVKRIIEVISERYSDSEYVIKLFGSDFENNGWLQGYVKEASNGLGQVEILDRLSKSELYAKMANCDIGISVIRDPDYDFGTKVFDYIALGLPVLNYFATPNSFTEYFNAYLDRPFDGPVLEREISRRDQIAEALSGVFR